MIGTSTALAAAAAGAPAPAEPAPGKARSRGLDFGHERRRVTDSLLLLNAVCCMLQWLTKGLLTAWGAKVGHACIPLPVN